MVKFLFNNKWIGYALGNTVGLTTMIFFGNISVGRIGWQFFAVDVLCTFLMTYSIGLLFESIFAYLYIRSFRVK